MAEVKSSKSRPKKSAKEHLDTAHATETVQGEVATTVATTETLKGTNRMSELTSIIEYNESLEAAEAPVPLPVGDYPAEIRGAEIKTSQNGNKYVNVTFYIAPESYPADFTEGDADGTTLSFGRLSPENTVKARYGMKKFATAIGAKLGKTLDLNDWIGLNAVVEIDHREWEGQKNPNIKAVKPA